MIAQDRRRELGNLTIALLFGEMTAEPLQIRGRQ